MLVNFDIWVDAWFWSCDVLVVDAIRVVLAYYREWACLEGCDWGLSFC